MKSFSLPAVLATVLVMHSAQPLFGQFETNAEQMEQLRPFVGDWEGDVSLSNGIAGTLTGKCKSKLRKSYVNIEWRFNGIEAFEVLVGYSGKTKKLHVWGFLSDTQLSGPASMEGNRLIVPKLTGVNSKGVEESRHLVYEVKGDTFTITATKVLKDGKAMPDETMVVKRKLPFSGVSP